MKKKECLKQQVQGLIWSIYLLNWPWPKIYETSEHLTKYCDYSSKLHCKINGVKPKHKDTHHFTTLVWGEKKKNLHGTHTHLIHNRKLWSWSATVSLDLQYIAV